MPVSNSSQMRISFLIRLHHAIVKLKTERKKKEREKKRKGWKTVQTQRDRDRERKERERISVTTKSDIVNHGGAWLKAEDTRRIQTDKKR